MRTENSDTNAGSSCRCLPKNTVLSPLACALFLGAAPSLPKRQPSCIPVCPCLPPRKQVLGAPPSLFWHREKGMDQHPFVSKPVACWKSAVAFIPSRSLRVVLARMMGFLIPSSKRGFLFCLFFFLRAVSRSPSCMPVWLPGSTLIASRFFEQKPTDLTLSPANMDKRMDTG